MTIGELKEKYPLIDWTDYINSKMSAGVVLDDSEVVVVQQPSYYDQLGSILNETERRTIANYIIWRDLADYIPYLTTDLRQMEFEFFRSVSGKSVKTARWSECVKGVASMMNVAVSLSICQLN